MLPVRYKPVNTYSPEAYITEIPNALSEENIVFLREYTKLDTSGFHRRGSKNKNTHASFYTCLFVDMSHQVYEVLSPLWGPYKSLSFIEPYEIKMYTTGDEFERHNDEYLNIAEGVQRAMNMVVQLSSPSDYSGGELVIGDYVCSKELGTAIMFPAAIEHCVSKITSGKRYSLIGHGWNPFKIW